MYALNEAAVLRARVGRGGGRPVYERVGTAFRCRSEPAHMDAARGERMERGAHVRIFAQGVNARPGDRVEMDGRAYRVSEVKRVRGLAGIHHLEILARAEARGGEGD